MKISFAAIFIVEEKYLNLAYNIQQHFSLIGLSSEAIINSKNKMLARSALQNAGIY